MIKLVYVVQRMKDVPEKDFYDYWLRSHGPRVKGHSRTLNMKKYVQSHLIDTPDNEMHRALRGMLPPAAGITEVWWDSLESYLAAMQGQGAKEASEDLLADEKTFIDIAASHVFLTQEHVIFDYADARPSKAKIVYLVSKADNLTVAECHRTWLEDHGPLVRKFSERLTNRQKYIQSHTIAPEINARIAKNRGHAPALDGVTEVWVDPDVVVPEDLNREANTALVADERRFVEFSRSRRFLTKEHLIFDYT